MIPNCWLARGSVTFKTEMEKGSGGGRGGKHEHEKYLEVNETTFANFVIILSLVMIIECRPLAVNSVTH